MRDWLERVAVCGEEDNDVFVWEEFRGRDAVSLLRAFSPRLSLMRFPSFPESFPTFPNVWSPQISAFYFNV